MDVPEQTTGTDLLAEAWAALLIREGIVAPDQVILRSHGQHGRTFRSDVVGTEASFEEHTQEEVLYLDVRRDGVYDGLPEALFHEADSGRSIKRNAAEDARALSARRFFHPFEQELFRLRTALFSDELEGAFTRTDRRSRVWMELWNIPEHLDNGARRALALVLPYAPQVIGHLDKAAACFAFVLGLPVSITLAQPVSTNVDTGTRSRSGTSELGATILGGVLREEWPHLTISVGGIPVAQLTDPGRMEALRYTLETLIGYLIPVHLGTSTELVVRDEDQGPPLGTFGCPMLLGLNSKFAPAKQDSKSNDINMHKERVS